MNIEINEIQLTMRSMAKSSPDDVVVLDFIIREDEGSVQINIRSERGYSARVTVMQDGEGVDVIIEDEERKTTTVPVLTWDDEVDDEIVI